MVRLLFYRLFTKHGRGRKAVTAAICITAFLALVFLLDEPDMGPPLRLPPECICVHAHLAERQVGGLGTGARRPRRGSDQLPETAPAESLLAPPHLRYSRAPAVPLLVSGNGFACRPSCPSYPRQAMGFRAILLPTRRC